MPRFGLILRGRMSNTLSKPTKGDSRLFFNPKIWFECTCIQNGFCNISLSESEDSNNKLLIRIFCLLSKIIVKGFFS